MAPRERSVGVLSIPGFGVGCGLCFFLLILFYFEMCFCCFCFVFFWFDVFFWSWMQKIFLDRSSHRVYTGQILVGFLKTAPFMWVLVESSTRMLRGFHRKPVQLHEKTIHWYTVTGCVFTILQGSSNIKQCLDVNFFQDFPCVCQCIVWVGVIHHFSRSHTLPVSAGAKEKPGMWTPEIEVRKWEEDVKGSPNKLCEWFTRKTASCMVVNQNHKHPDFVSPWLVGWWILMVYYHPILASSVVTRMIAGNPKKTQPPAWSSNQPTFFADFSPRNAFGS